jgi:sec-independent protein translocase protein TatA
MLVLAVGPFGLGPFELVLILAVIVIIFGVGKLPEVGGAIGKGIREFRKASNEDKDKDVVDRAQLTAPASTAAPVTAPPAAVSTAAPVMLCANPSCRSELPENAQFCLKCGTRVGAPAAPAS